MKYWKKNKRLIITTDVWVHVSLLENDSWGHKSWRRVTFFFYVIHIYLIHFLVLIVAEFTGFGWQKMILPIMVFGVEELKGFGFNLFIVYMIWILVVALLYPLCKKFDTYKQAHKEKWWLSYL